MTGMSMSLQRTQPNQIQPKTEVVRFSGISIESEFSLAIIWAEEKFDVNHYYALLGLPIDRPVLMWEIRKAFAQMMRRYHPDTGVYDQDMVEQLLVAYEILSDPQKRMEYDDLLPDETFIDRLMEENWRKAKARQAQREEKPIQDVLEEGVTTLTRKSYTPPQTVRPSARNPETLPLSGFLRYGYSDDPVEVEDPYLWIAEIALAYWNAGYVVQVLVGFTSSRYLVDDQGWGTIIFVPADSPRDPGVARALVDQVLETLAK